MCILTFLILYSIKSEPHHQNLCCMQNLDIILEVGFQVISPCFILCLLQLTLISFTLVFSLLDIVRLGVYLVGAGVVTVPVGIFALSIFDWIYRPIKYNSSHGMNIPIPYPPEQRKKNSKDDA